MNVARRQDVERTLDFCCSALVTTERYMSLLKLSSCFTREFVAMGRRISRLFVAAVAAVDSLVFDVDFLLEDILGVSAVVLDCGPALGVLWLNWERVEWGSMSNRIE